MGISRMRSSSNEDSPFVPELSQAFLNEIAEEEEEEEANLSIYGISPERALT